MDNFFGMRLGENNELFINISKTESIVGSQDEVWCNISLEIKNVYVNLSLEENL